MLVNTSFTTFNPISVMMPGFSMTSAKPYFTSSEWLILPAYGDVQSHSDRFGGENVIFLTESKRLIMSATKHELFLVT